MTFYLVEISDKLKEVQRDNILELLKKYKIYPSLDLKTQDLYENKLNIKFIWKKDFLAVRNLEFTRIKEQVDKAKTNITFLRRATIDENPFMILAHEFFDAMPVYQFIYDKGRGWLEKIVDIDPNNPDALLIRESDKPTDNVKKLLQPEKTFSTQEVRDQLQTGDMIEISPHSQSIMTEIAELIGVTKGCGLIVDYGEDQALTNSIRAISKHKYLSESEMLRSPGKADLSAYVNFRALKFAAKQVDGVITRGPIPQGYFLEAMGMNLRKEALKNTNKNRTDFKQISKRLDDDYTRLVHPDQMGEIYKFLFVGTEKTGEIFPFIEGKKENQVEYF